MEGMITEPRRERQQRSRMFTISTFWLCVVSAGGLMAQTSAPHLPTLTTAREAHELTLEEAAKSYPVRLTGVTTYYDPYLDTRQGILFVHDASGSIFIRVLRPLPPPLRPGTLVEVTGVSATGDFAPIVTDAQIRVIGKSDLPAVAPPVSLTQLLTGQFDGQWIEMEGVVHSFEKYGMNLDLDLSTSAGSVRATTLFEPGMDYNRLVNATIRIRANAAPIYNRNLQLTGARLLFPGLEALTIEQPAAADPFSLPITPVDRLLRFQPGVTYQHLVHLRGRVTLLWPGRMLCIQAPTDGLCVQTAETTRLATGDIVDLVGFPAMGGIKPTLTDSKFRSVGKGRVVTGLLVSPDKVLQGDHDSELIQIEGRLIGEDRGSSDPTMVLESGNFLVPVVLPQRAGKSSSPVWEDGSTLRVTGICSVKTEPSKTTRQGFSHPKSFKILLRTPDDVFVVRGPSWWTAAHLLPVLAVVLVVALCVLCWVGVLRQRITEQAKVIQEQNTTLRRLSFQDGLTGIPNRRRFDETLAAEYGRAAESVSPVSLLMVDIDHFKALNDAYGHQRGDECLVHVARALVAASVRKTDMVARYGGEEFAVVLPGCDTTEAFAIAERMRAAVIDLEIANAGSPIHGRVSVSVGVATVRPAHGADSATLIAMADGALYQSKLKGRNRITASIAGNPEGGNRMVSCSA